MEQLKNIYNIQQKLNNLNNLVMACPSNKNEKGLPFDKYVSVYIAYNVHDKYSKINPNLFPKSIHTSLHNVIFNRDLFGGIMDNKVSYENQIKDLVIEKLNKATTTPCKPPKFEEYGNEKKFNVILYNNFNTTLTNFRLAIYDLFMNGTEYKTDLKSKKDCTINGKIYNVFYDIKTKQPLYAVEDHYFSAGHSPHVSLPDKKIEEIKKTITTYLDKNKQGLDITINDINKVFVSIKD